MGSQSTPRRSCARIAVAVAHNGVRGVSHTLASSEFPELCKCCDGFVDGASKRDIRSSPSSSFGFNTIITGARFYYYSNDCTTGKRATMPLMRGSILHVHCVQ